MNDNFLNISWDGYLPFVYTVWSSTSDIKDKENVVLCMEEIFSYLSQQFDVPCNEFTMKAIEYCKRFDLNVPNGFDQDFDSLMDPKSAEKVKLIKLLVVNVGDSKSRCGDQFSSFGVGCLKSFREHAERNEWKYFHDEHYDWWMFPIPFRSSSYKEIFQVNEEIVSTLLSDKKYHENYKEGIRLVFESWGWDVENFCKVKSPTEDQKYIRYNIRLQKILQSLDFYVNVLWQNIFVWSNPKLESPDHIQYKELFLYLESAQKAAIEFSKHHNIDFMI